MRKVGTFLAVLLILGTVVACGDGDIGEDCDEEGVVGGECVDGAVCGKRDSQTAGGLVCLKQCTTQADCGSGEDCNGVGSTSLKGCRAKKP
jgi:hypothetical protein